MATMLVTAGTALSAEDPGQRGLEDSGSDDRSPQPDPDGYDNGDQSGVSASDQVIADDLIVNGSACVGFDCVDGESFGFDTVRLKENNLRLHFDDTSTTSGFAALDWRLVANDSHNGGLNYFAIEQESGEKLLTLDQNAKPVSTDSTGLGVGTDNPVVELHAVDGDTPTLRLEQDGSSWPAQTWDVGGNEASFFVRDHTGGSRLPFRIRPGAPTNALTIDASGDVAVGTFDAADSTEAALHVRQTDGDAKLLVEEASTTSARRELLSVENFGPPEFRFRNTESGDDWKFAQRNNGDFMISLNGTGGAEMTLDKSGNLIIAGGLTQSSDRARKTDIEPVEPDAVLAALRGIDVTTWRYLTDPASVRHMGAMAQDFFDAFGLGGTRTGISAIDTAGVAFAAIQAVSAQVDDLRAENADQSRRIAELEAENAELHDRLSDLERRMAALED